MKYPKLFVGDKVKFHFDFIVTQGLNPELREELKKKKYNKLKYNLFLMGTDTNHWMGCENTELYFKLPLADLADLGLEHSPAQSVVAPVALP